MGQSPEQVIGQAMPSPMFLRSRGGELTSSVERGGGESVARCSRSDTLFSSVLVHCFFLRRGVVFQKWG